MAKLTPKQELFVEEYLIDLNATQAAIRAGYSAKSASRIAVDLLNKTHVRSRVEERMAERSKRTGVNQERIIRELARIGLLDPTKLADMDAATILDTATEDDRAAIASVKVKRIPTQDGMGVEREIKFADKIKAIELLGKHLGMWIDRHQVDLSGRVELVDDIPKGE